MKEIDEKARQAIEGVQGIISAHINGYVFNGDIVDIANQSGLTSYVPLQLEKWKYSDFNYDADVYRLLIDSRKNEDDKTIENFFQNLHDNIKQFQCCKRFKKDKCDNPKDNYWNDDVCYSCDDFLDNGLRGILAKHLMTLGFVIDNDGYVSSDGEGTLDIDHLVNKMKEEVSNEVVKVLLPDDIISKGEDMSGVYTFLYCIENSLRIFVDIVLIEEFGDEYIDENTIPEGIKRKIEGRKKDEKSNKWLSIRGGNDLFYTDLDELGNIIRYNWSIFEKHFPDQNWIIGKITEISKCRHLVAHHSYIKKDERDLLGVYYKQILKQIQISEDFGKS